MDERQHNQLIGFAVLAILAYYVLGVLIPFLYWAVVIMVAWRIYLEHKKHK